LTRVLIGGKLHPSGLVLFDALPDYNVDYVEQVSTASLVPMI
jgi:hypothetical protein